MKKLKVCYGFTLVELMVSLVLGLLVVAAAIQLFSTIKNTYTTVSSLNARQEVVRFLSDAISQDVRTAASLEQPYDNGLGGGYDPAIADCTGGSVSLAGDDSPPFDSAPLGPTSWDDTQASVLIIDYSEGGESLRPDDPYCTSGDLQEVRYFSVEDAGGPSLSMCFKCSVDPTASAVQSLQEGVRVSFHLFYPEVNMYSVGMLDNPPTTTVSAFTDEPPLNESILGVKVMFDDDNKIFGQRNIGNFFSFHVTPRNAVVARELFGD
ncbi:prepilin-type N-terminal cleavage/methylation domain-containing protein [Halomonas sp. SSL-5]|uniref:PilW family protein n=1 Tax=Halomonas sp. SSL-5 TaxID=3065855 RepID=UPI00273A305D|nr:prepilin-type N-terminal cleavage/methylation domain-containing protein [Halomonas sp. SSL-5]MDY7117386.1 prepilin-type N-terminal cleavage/methylation domain-containing protein [Halomonas sp. SSL-5]